MLASFAATLVKITIPNIAAQTNSVLVPSGHPCKASAVFFLFQRGEPSSRHLCGSRAKSNDIPSVDGWRAVLQAKFSQSTCCTVEGQEEPGGRPRGHVPLCRRRKQTFRMLRWDARSEGTKVSSASKHKLCITLRRAGAE